MTDGEMGDAARGPRISERVAWSERLGFGYVPGRVVVVGDVAAQRVRELADDARPKRLPDRRDLPDERASFVVDGVDRPLEVVRVLRAEGLIAQPDHVLQVHCDPCACAPHPAAWGDGHGADPYKGNPYKGNPYKGNPYKGNPYKGNPYKGNPYKGNPTPGPRGSSARPAPGPTLPPRTLAGPGDPPTIVLLDTGLAGGTDTSGAVNADGLRPHLLAGDRIRGPRDVPDAPLVTATGAAWKADGWLDPVAGHGTFIAGIVEQLAPGCAIRVERVIGALGDVRETDVALALFAEALRPPSERPQLISMSFGGPVSEHAWLLEAAIALARLHGIVLIASAGNDGCSVPQLPAALDAVVAVAAVGSDGPAPFTNYGSWVDACAPGVELVSSFFATFDGPSPPVNTDDPDHFREWAAWSGTSFAAPVVVAAVAREMVLRDCAADVALDAVVHAPELLRLPCLGTVVGL